MKERIIEIDGCMKFTVLYELDGNKSLLKVYGTGEQLNFCPEEHDYVEEPRLLLSLMGQWEVNNFLKMFKAFSHELEDVFKHHGV